MHAAGDADGGLYMGAITLGWSEVRGSPETYLVYQALISSTLTKLYYGADGEQFTID